MSPERWCNAFQGSTFPERRGFCEVTMPDMIGAARLVLRAVKLTGLEPKLAAAWLRRVAEDVEKG